MKIEQRKFTGAADAREREYETEHRKTAGKAAAEGMVLLKNNHEMLPIAKGKKIALYGAGAAFTVKGGTGSGDVNSRKTVSIYEGLINAGYFVTTEEWIHDYEKIYTEERLKWRQEIWDKEDAEAAANGLGLFYAYTSTPFRIPAGQMPKKTDTDTAVYVISRNAGEGKDRLFAEGDYLLTAEEEAVLAEICKLYEHVLLALNIGGIIDLEFTEKYTQIEAILYMQQPGMEGGNAFADIISGAVLPSAKLTDTWAYDYQEYPSSKTFSNNDNYVDREEYKEGIYVGYRYFDTYDVPVRYGFGYGLSYTSYDLELAGIQKVNPGTARCGIIAEITVTNTGKIYAGKEVVQLYCCAPQEKAAKEYRKLVGFGKTKTLAPGESEKIKVEIPISMFAFFDEEAETWMIEKGIYGIFLGNSLESSVLVASIQAENDMILAETKPICPLAEAIEELAGNRERCNEKRLLWMKQVNDLPFVKIHGTDIVTERYEYTPSYEDMPKEVRDFVDSLQEEQLILLATGNIGKAQGAMLGSAGSCVPGSAAETSDCAEEQGLAAIILADGPAGIRLNQTYQIKEGEILPGPFEMALENGFLCRKKEDRGGETRYQFCTAFPVGTALAQSWDTELLKEVGKAVAEEMEEFGITLWLAPGMNIHRNPLCGRNFEYYSEDPVVSGYMAAAVTKGVQSVKGCGTTIKHFACNNQEDNRMGSDSVLGERTLREIYLKGFEIAVKESAPMAIMTSYNLINGIHAANNEDLCTKVVRNEWNYKGMLMTDWTTTMIGEACTAAGCMRAGNDVVMPGCSADHENIKEELASGTLEIKDLKRSVARLVHTVRGACRTPHTNGVRLLPPQ